jgi:hypothetical protein
MLSGLYWQQGVTWLWVRARAPRGTVTVSFRKFARRSAERGDDPADKLALLLAQPSLGVHATYRGADVVALVRGHGRADMVDMIVEEVGRWHCLALAPVFLYLSQSYFEC